MYKVKKKTPDQRQQTVFMSINVVVVSFFVNFGHISHRFLVLLLRTLNR